jgi:hypothetical protein
MPRSFRPLERHAARALVGLLEHEFEAAMCAEADGEADAEARELETESPRLMSMDVMSSEPTA